ncbi:MAG: hypothetical protein CSA65_01420 [Proteobacteria bacterium]|nr:MAG: hypothetical protein CSA65_01420 [Pseudomonadota bacterium]
MPTTPRVKTVPVEPTGPRFACRYSSAPWQGKGQRLLPRPRGQVFAVINTAYGLSATLAIPVGRPQLGLSVALVHRDGLSLRAWSAGRPLVRLYPRKPMHFGAVLVARAGLRLRWLGSDQIGTLRVTPASPLAHLTMKSPARMQVRCADVGPAPNDYRVKGLPELSKAKKGYRLLGGLKIPLSGGPSMPPQGTLLLPYDKRKGVLLLAYRQGFAHVFAIFEHHAIDAWIPRTMIREKRYDPFIRTPRWPSDYSSRRHSYRIYQAPIRRSWKSERWRCSDPIQVYLRHDGKHLQIGSFAAHRTLRLLHWRGLWSRIDPRSLRWLSLAPGADLVVNRASLSRCRDLRASLHIPPITGHSAAGRFRGLRTPYRPYGSFLRLRKRRASSAPGSVPNV